MTERHDWIDLSTALLWMQTETFRFSIYNPFSIYNHEEALKNALLSSQVPLRGIARYHSEYQRIEKYTTADVQFSIIDNLMQTKSVIFQLVQVDRRALKSWLNANAVFNANAVLPRPSKPRRKNRKSLKADAQKRTAKWVKRFIKEEEDAGRRPTISNAEKAGLELRLNREDIRSAYREIRPVQRGRPRNSPGQKNS